MGGRRQGDRGPPRGRPAGAGRHDLGRGLRAAVGAADQEGDQAHGAQRQARVRRARGRDDRRGGRTGRGHDRDQHGRPRRRHQARRQRRAPRIARGRQARPAAGDARLRRALRQGAAVDRGPHRGSSASRCWRPAACSSSAPSATSRAGSTTSCAAAPAARATPASRASSCRPRTTSCGCSPASGSTRSSTGSGTTDDEGNEEPIEAGMLSKQIEKAQRKVEEQHFLMRKHTLEYDDVLNQQREVIYTYRDEVLEGRDMSDDAREEIVNLLERLVEEYTAGDFVEDWDVRRPDAPRRGDLQAQRRAAIARPHADRPRGPDAAAAGRGARPVRPARGGARRGADAGARAAAAARDHRPALAGAPVRHGLPAARASTCAGSPRSSRWSPTRTRRSTCSATL